jgi:hypothetical protein
MILLYDDNTRRRVVEILVAAATTLGGGATVNAREKNKSGPAALPFVVTDRMRTTVK